MYALAFGIGTKNAKNDWLEIYYPRPVFKPEQALIDSVAKITGYKGGNTDIDLSEQDLGALSDSVTDAEQQSLVEQLKASVKPVVLTILESDSALQSTPETYLKLHLLSHRFVLPNEQNLEGIYPLLPNVAWTERGAVDLDELEALQLSERLQGRVLEVASIDKFPKMTNYVVPGGVRIAHSARVRLGAYVGDGTTVMHEGFMNFNAGTLGPNMIEGRVSQGVTVGGGSDLGGSASTAGTLSGGGNIVISIGKDCLISANAGTGIPLGDRCTIEAGLYITPGTVVQIMDEDRNFLKLVKARELAGQADMLFLRNSQNGIVECRTNRKAIELNTTLHSHN
ncbi:MAG: 2,3,4,5-tetrahydropyridine-2,6-dicarboxylate N-succinyltransferase [Gammaproteobacteria bacterium]|jgi:2,3,4,5-tetrahydropyridine-2,6-dicarboxylate N-succinyltransferase|nr:2,3,4,5-tetrahydropyridine-2,6-dicarboxylate N-succinyltransferase [Gammaproteobacteria bacterium]MBT4494003.1 2,3,4,5-tetrahydropyridine-2,6-dicarboxylate N-succinyltransferase [Gammaproteobacteria bacterium]MBT7369893.1 2,3,4,5-tetrahydropyridine-2,6-dicarboxylate N-succinyltransferase [Gammaproteobacteria bacterium]